MVTKRLKKVEVSYLIVNYRQKNNLDILLKDIQNKSLGFEYDIFIFDNSNDLNTKNYPNLYSVNKNIGFGKAVNFLSTKATGKYLIVLNPDVRVVKYLRPALTKYKKLPISKGVLGLGKSDKTYTLPIFTRFASKKRFSGYAFLIDKNLFKSVGGFSPEFFLYFEDSDLAQKLLKYGVGSASLKNPPIKHTQDYTNIDFKSRKIYYYQSLLIYLKKYHPLAFLFFKPFIVAFKYYLTHVDKTKNR